MPSSRVYTVLGYHGYNTQLLHAKHDVREQGITSAVDNLAREIRRRQNLLRSPLPLRDADNKQRAPSRSFSSTVPNGETLCGRQIHSWTRPRQRRPLPLRGSLLPRFYAIEKPLASGITSPVLRQKGKARRNEVRDTREAELFFFFAFSKFYSWGILASVVFVFISQVATPHAHTDQRVPPRFFRARYALYCFVMVQ